MTLVSNYNVFSRYEAKILRAIIESIITEDTLALYSSGIDDLIKKVDGFVSRFPIRNQMGIKLMLWWFELSPILFHFLPFSFLSRKRRLTICEKAENSRFYIRRGPMLLFKMMIMMFLYEHENIEEAIGYSKKCIGVP